MAASVGRRARVAALQALYESDVAEHPLEECLARQLSDRVDNADVADFTIRLARGVAAHVSEMDLIIQKAAPTWPLEQMAAVDRNILRLAVYELLHDRQAPVRAVINEAVDLAKTYGSESSGRFVNGVLGSISLTATC